jgi:hypothetical protein
MHRPGAAGPVQILPKGMAAVPPYFVSTNPFMRPKAV